MSQGDTRRRRADRRRPRPRDAESTHRTLSLDQWLRIAVLVLLIAVLLMLVFLLLRQRANGPKPPENVQTPVAFLAITGPNTGDAPLFDRPLAAVWGPDGRIYVSDTGNRRICVFDSTGRFIREFGRVRPAPSQPYRYALDQPAGLAVGANGTVYVADVRGAHVVVFNNVGRVVHTIQPLLPANSARWTPTAVSLTSKRIYVTDATGIAVFALPGKPAGHIGGVKNGTAFSHPNGVVVRADGTLLVSDTNNTRVVAIRPNGSLLWSVGPSIGNDRVIGLPRGLGVAPNGTVLVADAFLFGVDRISSQGVYVDRYGDRGSALGEFEFPNDVSTWGEVVLVTDKENNRVQLIRYPGLLETTATAN